MVTLEWIKKRIKDIKRKHQTINPFSIAKDLGIVLSYAPLGETLGFFFHDSRIKFININSDIDEQLQRFVCAHELGHAILHPRANTPFLKKNTFFSVDKIEVEANYFAVHLLLSNEDLKNYETKYQVLREHGIPLEMERFL